jgi:hypothetical protein
MSSDLTGCGSTNAHTPPETLCTTEDSRGGNPIAVSAARHYRRLPGMGISIRSSIDRLIGTFCIERVASLLHHYRADFLPMEKHLDLRCV